MEDNALIDVFNQCADRLSAGQTVEDCLNAYPEYARELAPMLEAGLLARRARTNPEEVARAQDRVRERFAEALFVPEAPQDDIARRFVLLIAALLILIPAVGGILIFASQDSLPGDLLYEFKLFTEDFRVNISDFDPILEREFAERRVEEVRQLLAAGRATEVQFNGTIDALTLDGAVIEGMNVRVNPTTPGAANVLLGARVQVRGLTTENGNLVAINIVLLAEPIPGLLPEPTITAIPMTPTITPTPEPTGSPTPVTPTGTSTEIPTRRPTSTPTSLLLVTNTPETVPTSSGANLIASPTPTPTPTSASTATTAVNVTQVRPTPSASATTSTIGCVISPPANWERYAIQEGDALSVLAIRTGTTVEEIVRINCISDANQISIGQVLFLPAASAQGGVAVTVTPDTTREGGDVNQNPNVRPTATSTPQRNNTGGTNG